MTFDGWFDEVDLELQCTRCGRSVMEGLQRDAEDFEFWCSPECMAADGHDPSKAYRTVSEIED